MVTSNATHRRKLTMDQFSEFVRRATPNQIAKIHVDQLPENIPESLADSAPYETRHAIENLIFEANAYQINLAIELEAHFGPAINNALALAKQKGDSRSHLLFKRKVSALVALFNQSKKDPAILKSDSFNEMMLDVRRLLEDLRQESGALAHARHYIEQRLLNAGPKFLTIFKSAIKVLTKRFADIERSMNLFFYVSVMLSANEMNYVRDRIIDLERKGSSIKVRLEEQREQLRRLQGNAITRRTKKHLITELQTSITELLAELSKYEVMVSETDLLAWLDTVVEASMSGYVRKQAGSVVGTARLGLFGLLQKYCMLQEDSALQVARNPFSQIDPKKSIQYMIKSEQFILDYFSNKKSSITAWLGEAAQNRIDSLGVLEKQLMTEMRKNIKRVN